MHCATCNAELPAGSSSCPTCSLRRTPRERSASAVAKDLQKAAELYTLAMADREKGNLVSARMNMKLAVTFDPMNPKYREAYVRLESTGSGSSIPAAPAQADPTAKFHPTAKKAFDEACSAEEAGDLDRAIRCYEIALRVGEHAIILSKLGLLYATHRGDFTRGKEMCSRAVILQPDNAEIKANKTKLLAASKADKVEKRSIPPASTSGFWKMFKRD